MLGRHLSPVSASVSPISRFYSIRSLLASSRFFWAVPSSLPLQSSPRPPFLLPSLVYFLFGKLRFSQDHRPFVLPGGQTLLRLFPSWSNPVWRSSSSREPPVDLWGSCETGSPGNSPAVQVTTWRWWPGAAES